MDRHGNRADEDGQGNLDLSQTKSVAESSGGAHSTDDQGDEDSDK